MRRTLMLVGTGLAVTVFGIVISVNRAPTQNAAKAIVPPIPSNLDRTDAALVELINQTRSRVIQAPGDSAGWLKLGMIYEANQHNTFARVCYEQATVLDPADVRSWFHKAGIRFKMGDTNDAIDAMRSVTQLQPDFAPGHWKLGFWVLNRNEIDDAESLFTRATQVSPGDATGWFGLAIVRMRQHRNDEAAKILEKLIEWTPINRPHAHQLLGTVYRRLGRIEDAEHALLASEGKFIPWPDPWSTEMVGYYRGERWKSTTPRQMMAQGRLDEAIALLESLLRDEPDNVILLNNIAMVYRSKGELGKSIETLNRVIEQQELVYMAHYNLAVNYLLLIDETSVPGAVEQYVALTRHHAELTLEINPSHRGVHGILGRLAETAGDMDLAVEEYRIGAREPELGQLWLTRLCALLIQVNRLEEAAESLEEISYRFPPQQLHVYQLAVAQHRIGRNREAASTLDRYDSLWPNDDRISEIRRRIQQLKP